jgi:hypothetical protein
MSRFIARVASDVSNAGWVALICANANLSCLIPSSGNTSNLSIRVVCALNAYWHYGPRITEWNTIKPLPESLLGTNQLPT